MTQLAGAFSRFSTQFRRRSYSPMSQPQREIVSALSPSMIACVLSSLRSAAKQRLRPSAMHSFPLGPP